MHKGNKDETVQCRGHVRGEKDYRIKKNKTRKDGDKEQLGRCDAERK